MLLPINTDAPIYHFPAVTIGLIVANVAAAVAAVAGGGFEAVEPWFLSFGRGLHPLQWLSHAFLHGDVLHLLGNMFFLWGFGLVVEGKLGWWRYLAVYLGVAAAVGLVVQVMMLGYDGDSPGAVGASAAVFGLMAMALVWAPKNDMTIFTWIVYRPLVFEAPILGFCGFYIAWQAVLAALTGFSMGGAIGHLLGAAGGFAIGIVLLKKECVDCEGWDLFAVMSGDYGSSRRMDEEFHYREAAYALMRSPSKPVAAEPDAPRTERAAKTSLDPKARLKRFLEAGDSISASGEYEKLRAFDPMWRPDRETLLGLGEGLYRDKAWEDAEPVLRDYLARFAGDDEAAATRVRLKLARIAIDLAKRPGEGLNLLGQVDPATLPPKSAAGYRELRKRAEAALARRA